MFDGCWRRAAVETVWRQANKLPRAPHLLRQQDGPHRRRLLQGAWSTPSDRPGQPAVPIQLPIGAEADFRRRRRLVTHEGLDWRGETIGAPGTIATSRRHARTRPTSTARCSSKVSETDDEIMEKFLEGESRAEDRSRGIIAVAPLTVVPVLWHRLQEQGRAADARRGRDPSPPIIPGHRRKPQTERDTRTPADDERAPSLASRS